MNLAIDKILDATAGHPFGLSIDADKFGSDSTKEAQIEFDNLFNSRNGFEEYYKFVQGVDGAVPVLQTSTHPGDFAHQMSHVEAVDRGLIVHHQRSTPISLLQSVITSATAPSDTLFVVDAGWSRDTTQMESWAISQAVFITNFIPGAELVIMSSSFPDSFNHISGNAEEPAHEIAVFQSVRQRLQAANLSYGDWGSTRPSQSGGGGKIPPRIDVPRSRSWHIFRPSPDDDATYFDVAQAAVSHSAFTNVPDCWGKLQIQSTDGQGSGITGVKMNTSARINIHMTIQTGASQGIDLDEQPYED